MGVGLAQLASLGKPVFGVGHLIAKSGLQDFRFDNPQSAIYNPQWMGPTFRAVVTTIVPQAAHLDAAGWQGLEKLVAEMIEERPENLRRQLRMFLRSIEWMPVLRYGRTFSALPARDRTRVLAWLQNHPVTLVRVGFWGLRTMALLGYYGRPEALPAIGYAASVRGWEAVR